MNRTGLPGEALGLFVHHLFQTWPFRKLYGEVDEVNYASFAGSAGKLFEVEGILRAHDRFGDDYWDRYLISIDRARWSRTIGPVIERVVEAAGDRPATPGRR